MTSVSPKISASALVSVYSVAFANDPAAAMAPIRINPGIRMARCYRNPYTRPSVNQEQRTFLQQSIRTIADYPRPGIQFRDITTLLRDARAFALTIESLVTPWIGAGVDKVAGIEARGFILGGAVAHHLKAGFIPIRKRGKLPHETVRVAYSLEYGVDEMEMHRDAVQQGEKV